MRTAIHAGLVLLSLAGQSFAAGNLPLIDAVKDQDRRAVDKLIAAKTDVNAPQPDGATALAWAVYLDQADTVDLLLKAGAKVNTADEYGETPLTLACGTGNTAIIGKLLKKDANPNAARWNGESALMIAARSGSAEGVRQLIANGAKVDAVESCKGQNALMWAAAEGHSDVVDVLLQNSANAKIASKAGFSPLLFAAQKGDAKSVAALIAAGSDPSFTLPDGMSVLLVAAAGGKNDAAEVLLEKGAKVNVAERTGNSALHLAAQAGNVELMKLLLAKGADPNQRTAKVLPNAAGRGGGGFFRPIGEQTPLMLAARANHEEAMRILVSSGADPKLKAQDGTTLLMSAAGSGHIGVVRYAYELSPDIKAVTERKSAVLHAAVTGSMFSSTQAEICEVIQFLADKGADLDPQDASGRTAIQIADILPIDKAVELMTKLIIQSGQQPKTPSKR